MNVCSYCKITKFNNISSYNSKSTTNTTQLPQIKNHKIKNISHQIPKLNKINFNNTSHNVQLHLKFSNSCNFNTQRSLLQPIRFYTTTASESQRDFSEPSEKDSEEDGGVKQLRKNLRLTMKALHPDRFALDEVARETNQEAFQVLQSILSEYEDAVQLKKPHRRAEKTELFPLSFFYHENDEIHKHSITFKSPDYGSPYASANMLHGNLTEIFRTLNISVHNFDEESVLLYLGGKKEESGIGFLVGFLQWATEKATPIMEESKRKFTQKLEENSSSFEVHRLRAVAITSLGVSKLNFSQQISKTKEQNRILGDLKRALTNCGGWTWDASWAVTLNNTHVPKYVSKFRKNLSHLSVTIDKGYCRIEENTGEVIFGTRDLPAFKWLDWVATADLSFAHRIQRRHEECLQFEREIAEKLNIEAIVSQDQDMLRDPLFHHWMQSLASSSHLRPLSLSHPERLTVIVRHGPAKYLSNQIYLDEVYGFITVSTRTTPEQIVSFLEQHGERACKIRHNYERSSDLLRESLTDGRRALRLRDLTAENVADLPGRDESKATISVLQVQDACRILKSNVDKLLGYAQGLNLVLTGGRSRVLDSGAIAISYKVLKGLEKEQEKEQQEREQKT